MGRMRLLSEAAGGTVEGFCIVRSVQVKTNIKGSTYLDFVLADCEGEVDAKLWDYNVSQHGIFDAEQVVKIRATINMWKDAEQLKIDRIRHAEEADGVDMSLLVPCAPFDAEWMYQQLFDTADGFADDGLKRLTQYLLRANKQQLLRAPAAVKLHHATRAGLLHHTYSVLMAAKALCPLYPLLDTDLVYTGAILHDIAKIEELEVGALGLSAGYTEAGQLIGHITLGVGMVAAACEALDIPYDTCILVQHMLLSHHGLAEYGSPRPPMFPEAELLSELDMLDSRLYEMFDALSGVPKGGFSERVWALENRQLFQHGHSFAPGGNKKTEPVNEEPTESE